MKRVVIDSVVYSVRDGDYNDFVYIFKKFSNASDEQQPMLYRRLKQQREKIKMLYNGKRIDGIFTTSF